MPTYEYWLLVLIFSLMLMILIEYCFLLPLRKRLDNVEMELREIRVRLSKLETPLIRLR
jgi:hypothetical protein